MEKKSGRDSKVFLSTLNMKTAVIHDKNHVYDCIELHRIHNDTYNFKSITNNKYYCSHPLVTQNNHSDFAANRDQAQAWEHFELQKAKTIVLKDEVLNSLNKISE